MALRALLTGSSARATTGRVPRAARQVARRPAVREHQRRSADRVPDRRHHREHHQQPVAAARPPRRAAQPGVPLQGAAGGSGDRRPGAERAHDPDRARRPAGGHARTSRRSSSTRPPRRSSGASVPPEDARPDGGPGRDRLADLRGAAAEAHRRAEEEAAQASDGEPRGVPGIPARPAPLAQLERRTASGAPSSTSSGRSSTIPGYALAYAGLGNAFGAHGLLRLHAAGRRLPARPRGGAARASSSIPTSRIRTSRSASSGCSGGWDWPARRARAHDGAALEPAARRSRTAVYAIFLHHARAVRRGHGAKPQRAASSIRCHCSSTWACRWVPSLRRPSDEDASARRCGRRETAPGFEEAGNMLMAVYEDARTLRGGRGTDPTEQRCWGVRARRQALAGCLSQRRREGLLARAARADGAAHCRRRRRRSTSPSRSCYTQLGEFDKALDHLERMVTRTPADAVFIGVDPWLRRCAAASLRSDLKRIGAPLPQTA